MVHRVALVEEVALTEERRVAVAARLRALPARRERAARGEARVEDGAPDRRHEEVPHLGLDRVLHLLQPEVAEVEHAVELGSRPAPNLGHLLRAVGVEAGLLGRRSKVTRDVGVVRHDERDLLAVGEVIDRLAEPPAERAVERPAQVEG